MRKLNVLTAVLLAGLFIAGCSQKDTVVPADEETLTLKSASVAGKFIVVLKEDAGIAQADLQTRNAKVKAKALGLLKKYVMYYLIADRHPTLQKSSFEVRGHISAFD